MSSPNSKQQQPQQQKKKKNNKTSSTVDEEVLQKKKIRPTDSIFNRIKWDISIPKDQVLIGYLDRFIGIVEVPFNKWKGVDEHEGVPMHRIRYYKLNGNIIWDREKKIDLVTGGDVSHLVNQNISQTTASSMLLPSTNLNKQKLKYPFKEQIPYYRFNTEAEEWETIRSTSHTRSVKLQDLRILNFNILFDMHETDKIFTPKRVPYIMDILKNSNADIIALEEVRQSFLQELANQDWVQQNYFISDLTGECTLGEHYGQVLLSRIEPNALYLYRFSEMKSVLLPLYLIIANDGFIKERLMIPIVHLSSDHAQNCTAKRTKQLQQIFSEVQKLEVDHTIIVGDFNFSDGEPENDQILQWGRDAWLETHDIKKKPGYTFDPLNNICAAITTKKGIARRLDRIVYNSEKFIPDRMVILGTQVLSFVDDYSQSQIDLHPSDHFAIQCDFNIRNIGNGPDIKKVHTSTLAIVPPKSLWKSIQKIRRESDPAAKRWPPHINLLYPFFEHDQLTGNVRNLIENKMSGIEPFMIKLNKFDCNDQGTVYLVPETSNGTDYELLQLHTCLLKAFPTCNDSSKLSDGNFTPQMTVAQFQVDDVQSKMSELQNSWRPVEFLVDTVYVLTREENQPFTVKYAVPLGSNPTLRIEDIPSTLINYFWKNQLIESREASQLKKQALDYIHSTILTNFSANSDSSSGLSHREYMLKTFGSYRLGIKAGDIDAVCICTSQNPGHTRKEFLEMMKYVLSDDTERIESCRTILDALVPMLSIKFTNGVQIDLLYLHIPAAIEDSDAAIKNFGKSEVMTIAGLREAAFLLKYVPNRKHFQLLLSFIKFWAKQRGLYSNAFGYLGGVSYAILCAYICRNHPAKDGEIAILDLIQSFFAVFSKWKWPQPVSLTTSDAATSSKYKELFPVMLPTYPYANSTRNVTASTQKILIAELRRGYELINGSNIAEISPNQLLEEITMSMEDQFVKSYSRYIEIEFSALNGDEFEMWNGWIRSRIVNLAVNLDKHKVTVHINPNITTINTADERKKAQLRIGIVSVLSDKQILQCQDALNAFTTMITTWENRPSSSAFEASLCDTCK